MQMEVIYFLLAVTRIWLSTKSFSAFRELWSQALCLRWGVHLSQMSLVWQSQLSWSKLTELSIKQPMQSSESPHVTGKGRMGRGDSWDPSCLWSPLLPPCCQLSSVYPRSTGPCPLLCWQIREMTPVLAAHMLLTSLVLSQQTARGWHRQMPKERAPISPPALLWSTKVPGWVAAGISLVIGESSCVMLA